jgi:hypothetical protein
MPLFSEILEDIERIEFGFKTKRKEFTYDYGTFVSPNTSYVKVYTNDKSEYCYLDPGSHDISKEIFSVDESKRGTHFQYVNNFKGNLKRENYLIESKPSLTANDYLRENISRYFAKYKLEKNANVIEINGESFSAESKFYDKVKVNWPLVGSKEYISELHTKIINDTNKRMNGINKVLRPLEYWKPRKGSKDDTVKKLKFIGNY